MGRPIAIVSRLIRSGTFVFLAVLALHGMASREAPIVTGDTKVFTLMADQIVVEGWSVVLDREFLITPKWTRLLYVAIIIGARAIAPDQWPLLLVIVNLVCSATLAVLIVRLTLRVTGSAAAGYAALLFYAGAFEIVFWVRYVLSDTPFSLLAFLPFYILVWAITDPAIQPRFAAAAAATAAFVSLFVRPTALAMIPLVAIGAVWLTAIRAPATAERWRPAVRVFAALLLAFMAFVVLIHAALMQRPDRWPFPLMKKQIAVMAHRASTGEVVVSRPATFHAPPESMADYAAIDAARFVRFFQYVAYGYSRGHNLVNALYFTPLYALALLALSGARGETDSRRAVILLAASWVVVYAWFHAVTILDFNWRYRLPVMPHLIVLAAIGVDGLGRFIVRWKERRSPAAAAFPGHEIQTGSSVIAVAPPGR